MTEHTANRALAKSAPVAPLMNERKPLAFTNHGRPIYGHPNRPETWAIVGKGK